MLRGYIAGLSLFVLSLMPIIGQETEIIPLSGIIELAIEQNPSLNIMRNRVTQAENSHTARPFLPSLNANVRVNNSTTDSKRTFQDREQEFPSAKSENVNAGVNLTWTVFDGLGMFADYKRSSLNLSLREVEMRTTLENLLVLVSDYYYSIIVQQHRVDAAQQLMELSKERYRIISEKVDIGSAAGIDLLQAQLDLNADSSNLVRQKETLNSLYLSLNRYVNQPLLKTGYVKDSILLGPPLTEQELIMHAEDNNTDLIAARLGMEITKQDLNLAKSRWFPTINLVSGYSYSRSESPASVMTFSQSTGFNYGAEVTMNIFDGFQITRNVKNAKIELESKRLSYEDVHLSVIGEIHTLYSTYLTNLMMVDFERQNVDVARSNLDIALERYELGVLSGIEFREFQQAYINAVNRWLDATYQSKVRELSLLIISGQSEVFLSRIN